MKEGLIFALSGRWARVLVLMLVLVVVASVGGCGKEAATARNRESAAEYFAKGDYDSAEVEYRKLLDGQPDDLEGLRNLGVIWLERGAPLRAARLLMRAKELAPDDAEVRVRLGEALLALGGREEAWRAAGEVLEEDGRHGGALLLLVKSAGTEEQIAEAQRRLAAVEPGDGEVALAEALLAMRRGQAEEAGVAIERALEVDRDRAEALALKANWHQLRGEMTEANAAWEAAVAVAPLRSAVRLRRASFLMETGRRGEAVAMLEELTGRAPDFLGAWRLLASEAMARKDPATAEQRLAKVFARDPIDLEAGLMQGEIWLAGGESGKALKLMEDLAKVHPTHPLVRHQLARALVGAGEPVRALAEVGQLLEQQPGYVPAIRLRAQIQFGQGQFAEVVDALQAFLKVQPGVPDDWLLLGEANLRLGQLDDAAAALRRATDGTSPNARALLRLGQVLAAQDKRDEAREVLERAQKLEPADANVATALVKLDLMAGDHEAALGRAQAQQERNPQSVAARHLMAMVLVALGKKDEAVGVLEEAIRLDPNHLPSYQLLAGLHREAGRSEQVLEQFERIREHDPKHLPALVAAAAIYQETGRLEKARERYEEALAVDPDCTPALNNLATILCESPGDLARAAELALRARSLEPDSAAVLETLGWVRFKQGDYSEAHALLKQAFAQLPNQPVVALHFGLACWMAGQEDEAREALAAAVAQEGDFPGKAEARERIERLDSMAGLDRSGWRARVAGDPDDVIAWLRLAAALEKESRPAEAAEALKTVLQVNPGLWRAWCALAQLQAGPLEDLEGAMESAKRARELAPRDPEAVALLGRLAFRSGDHSWADSLLQESVRMSPADTGLAVDAAWAAYSVGRVDPARRLMESVADASEPGSADGVQARRLLDFVGGKSTAGAIEAALAADPSHVPALVARAEARESGGEIETALDDYRRVLEIYPGFTPARKSVARLEAELDKEAGP